MSEDAGFDIEDSIAWLHGQGKPATRYRLKPAHEPIVLARRPAWMADPALLPKRPPGQ